MQKTQLRTSVLGRTGLEITRVGFGRSEGYGHRDIAGLYQVLAATPGQPAMSPAGAGPAAS